MIKDFNISRLCDIYGALLTEHRRDILRSYYDDDLSLSEIAENFGITRQAALCSIRQAEAQLTEYERKLNLAARMTHISDDLKLLECELQSAQAKTIVERLKNELV